MFNTLLVDNNVCYRQALSDILLLHFPSIGVEEACTGRDALSKVEYLRPNLIFMDIYLPEENGLEVTREIKRVYSDIVIVILTSKDQPEYRQQAFRNGVDNFLSKQDDLCVKKILAQVDVTLAENSRDSFRLRP